MRMPARASATFTAVFILGLLTGYGALSQAQKPSPKTASAKPTATKTKAAKPAALPPARYTLQEEGGPKLESANMFTGEGSKIEQLFRPEAGDDGSQERLVVRGVLVDKKGSPLPNKTVYLFPTMKGIAGVIALIDGEVINPSATTGSDGRFELTVGPLWQESLLKTFVVGTYSGKPSEGSLATIHPIAFENKPVETEASAQARDVDLGTVRVE